MREIRLAETAGFCFGVKRAVETVYKEAESNSGKVYTYGPIIHNEEVVRDLEEKGVRVIHNEEELKKLKDGTVIIRSHGVGPQIYRIAEENGIRIVDATCPFVAKIHGIVRSENTAGRRVIIVGDPSHPEVEGIRGWGREDTAVIESFDDFKDLNIGKNEELSLVSQTTHKVTKFQEIVDKIKAFDYYIRCFNTICNATQERQTEAERIASEADAMIVIGGKSSSNTRKLAEICSAVCQNTFLIQTHKDIDPGTLAGFERIGITAGASTPKHIIEEVQTIVRSEF